MTRRSLPISSNGNGIPRRNSQPFSARTLEKHSRTRGATLTHSICPYCAVGCAINIFTKDGQVIDIEGNPDGPINEGCLCPKGANTFQLGRNAHRGKRVLYRKPYSDQWEVKSIDWAVEQIAQRVKKARDEDFQAKTENGRMLNAVKTIGCLGGATLDIEENYLMKKLFGAGLGMISIENQARI
jgi:formate dehydrogenase major subunit